MAEKMDTLPKKLCGSCYNCLVSFYDFRIQAEKVDSELKLIETMTKEEILPTERKKSYDLEIKVENAHLEDSHIVNDDFDNSYHDLDMVKEEHLGINLSTISNESNPCKATLVSKATYKKAVCDKKLRNMSKLEKRKDKYDWQLYSCSFCGDTFVQKDRLIKHLAQHSQKTDNSLLSEINQNSMCQSLICDICSARFKSVHSLSAHMRVHVEKGRVLSCSLCDKVFKKMSHLKRHELTHEVNRPFKCSVCPKSFTTESLLSEHTNKHNSIKPHECPLCTKSFSNISSLTTHLKIHTKEKIYLCSTCGKKFDSSGNLNQHMKRHIGLKVFACNMCPRSFVSKGELKSHTITHTGEKSYTCDQCGASFTNRNSLKKHKLRHLGIKPHQCDTCSRKFISKDHLKRHYRIHTGEKPFRCEICDRAFTQSNDLVKHRRAHLGDKLYRCTQCSESFRLKNELRNHISEHFITSQLQGINLNRPQECPNLLVNDKADMLKNSPEICVNKDDT
ncbi:hypothetical protein evm_005910 [Chilo suppressalis]|nr:hypothetical protein evm_005910 [Chilo suppressalis]